MSTMADQMRIETGCLCGNDDCEDYNPPIAIDEAVIILTLDDALFDLVEGYSDTAKLHSAFVKLTSLREEIARYGIAGKL